MTTSSDTPGDGRAARDSGPGARAAVVASADGDASVRVRLGISYDGAEFSGWAFQPDRRTVAGEIDRALTLLFGRHERLTVAGRTDAGVHASGQVAHVDVPAAAWGRFGDRVLRRVNGVLPADVRVTRADVVDATFDARFSALWRRYVYRVADHEWGVEPLRRDDTLAWPRRLDVGAMRLAAATVVGEHDFAAFCRRRDGATTVREIQRFDVDRHDDGIVAATITADAFCHSMVRSLVGGLLAVGEGRKDPEWFAAMRTLGRRSDQIVVAPPHGLTLVEVGYPDAAAFADRQRETRRFRGPVDPR